MSPEVSPKMTCGLTKPRAAPRMTSCLSAALTPIFAPLRFDTNSASETMVLASETTVSASETAVSDAEIAVSDAEFAILASES